MIQHREPPEAPAAEASDGTENRSSSGYTVRLDRFEGPMDLLLYLIQRDEIDIYDIPIAHITKEYLESLELLDVFNLDNAGEFLVMAATLMRIKARMLLPIQRPGEDEDEGDPRDDLVRRLLEYKKYKEASEKLRRQEDFRRDWFRRGLSYPFAETDPEPAELQLSLFDLLQAVKNVLDQMQAERVHEVYTEIYTVESQREVLADRLRDQKRFRFTELFENMRVKMQVVVTFVALLDLVRAGTVRLQQSRSYGDLWLVRTEVEAVDSDSSGEETLIDPTDEDDERGEAADAS